MPRKRDYKACWYETQRLADEWVMWEQFHYNHDAYPSERGPARVKARAAAIRSAKDCFRKSGRPTRTLHVERIFTTEPEDNDG